MFAAKNMFATNSAVSGVVFDATGTGNGITGSSSGTVSTTWSHTVGGSASYLFVAGVFQIEDGANSMSASCGSTTMTQICYDNYLIYVGYYWNLGVFALKNPPTGAQTITLYGTGITGYALIGNSVSYNGVSSLGSTVTSNGNSGTASVTTTSGVPVFNVFSPTGTAYTGTTRFNLTAESNSLIAGDAQGGTNSVTLTSTHWGAFGVPLVH